MPYMTEAMLAADEGVPLALIDRAAVDFGMPMGPIELADTVGLDVASHVGKILSAAFGLPVPRRTAELLAAGHVGRKSGRGYYEWRMASRSSRRRTGHAPDDLIDRLILQYLNEAVACLRERVVEDADLLDAGHDLRHGLRALSRRPVALRPRTRRVRDRRAARRARGEARAALQARCGLGRAQSRPVRLC